VKGACALGALLLLTACDQGHQDDENTLGPNITLVAANVGNNEPFPADGIIQLTFDRLLLPASITRQSIAVTDTTGSPFDSPIIIYDPVGRVVSIANPNPIIDGGGTQCWLTANQFYNVVIGIPSGTADTGGIRAIDGATLASPLQIGFNSGGNPCPPTPPPVTPHADFCADVLPIFQARCSAPQCHGSPQDVGSDSPLFPNGYSEPAAGLVLDNPAGVYATAVGRVSNGSNTGPMSTYEPPGALFGIDMPLIDPTGNAGNSYLLYKLLLADPSPVDDPGLRQSCALGVNAPTCPASSPADSGTCTLAADAGACFYPDQRCSCSTTWDCPAVGSISTIAPFAPGPQSGPMSNSERVILSNYILGREMPYPTYPGAGDPFPPDAAGGNAALSFNELERVRAWIANYAGAPLVCPVCGPFEVGDGGVSDAAATMDARSDAPSDAPADALSDAPSEGASDGSQD
jgi:hypothetical protein